jgi:alpha-methylacyl-CoA racemase
MLSGVRVVELGGLAPAPYCGMVLKDFGASVVRVLSPSQLSGVESLENGLNCGKKVISANLKEAHQLKALRRLLCTADVLIDPFRPGVLERLGLAPLDILGELNKRLVVLRLTGFGQSGALCDKAGHDINYLAVSGVLSLLGRADERPHWPANFLADFAAGGMLGALGVVMALYERERTGCGKIIDAAMVDGAAYLSTFAHALRRSPLWSEPRGRNMLDGGAPFYECYATSDARYMAVGAIEAHFYERFVRTLFDGAATADVDADALVDAHMDREQWPALRRRFGARFAAHTQEHWAAVFEHVDACVTPVLSLEQLKTHRYATSRPILFERAGAPMPRPAPRVIESSQDASSSSSSSSSSIDDNDDDHMTTFERVMDSWSVRSRL